MASIIGTVTLAGDQTDWIVVAWDATTHAFAASATPVAGEYTLTGLTAGQAYVVGCRPVSGPAWTPEAVTVVGDIVTPTDPINNPYTFKASAVTPIGVVDDDFASVVLLLHTDGADDGTSLPDVTGKTVSRGGVVTKTGVKKFGTASAYFDGAGDYLLCAASEDWSLGNTYTIEFWAYPSALPASGTWCRLFSIGVNGSATALTLQISDAGVMICVSPSLGATGVTSSSGAFSTDGWHHYAVSVSGGQGIIFKDGAAVSPTSTVTAQSPSAADGLVIGYSTTPTVDANYHGYLDDIRITKGVARYTTPFTPPSAAFPDVGPDALTSVTEPVWPTGLGETTTDGGVTWENAGRMVRPLMHGPLVAA